MAMLILQILLLASLAISMYMIVVTLERCRSEKRYAFVYCVVTLILYNAGYFIEISSGNLGGAVIGVKIMYSGGIFMGPLFFFFVADYCELRIPKKYYFIPLLVIPVIFYCMVATFDSHRLIYSNFWYEYNKLIPTLEHEAGVLYFVGQLYPVFCVVLSCIVLVRGIIKQNKFRRIGLILLLVSALAPLTAHFVYLTVSRVFGTSPNFTAFLMILSIFIFFYTVVRKDMFDLAPKAHAITMDLIRDAFIVLDWSMAYTGSNKNAQEHFPGLAELQKGSSILDLETWPKEISGETGMEDHEEDHLQEIQFSLPHKSGKIYSGWTNIVTSDSGAILGWVVLIQDITETVSMIRNIKAQRDEIAAMRDNLKEGIFLMDREFIIQDSYSKAMEDILSCRELQNRRFIDLLGNSFSAKDLATIEDYFNMFMDMSFDPEMLEEINPLGEFYYNAAETGEQKTLRCQFAPVDQGDGEIFVMGTVQDISAETILKKQLAAEEEGRQEDMRNLFEVMQVDQNVFENFSEDADYEFKRIMDLLCDNNISNRKKLIYIFQSVHAVKSNALIVGLSGYGEKLHNLETKIKALMDCEEEPENNEVSLIGNELVKSIQEKEKFPEILERLRNFSASSGVKKDTEIFIDTIKKACEKVATDKNKKVDLVTETIDQSALTRGPRRLIKEVLTQLIRNAVHHGIEKPEERLALGKDETGKISLKISIEGDVIRIILSDDGRGLDFDRIREEAKAKGLLENMPEKEINLQFLSNIIFAPGFSTSETDDIHAGRGIGLNLVRDRLKEVNGKIRINTKKGQGLVFEVQIPVSF